MEEMIKMPRKTIPKLPALRRGGEVDIPPAPQYRVEEIEDEIAKETANETGLDEFENGLPEEGVLDIPEPVIPLNPEHDKTPEEQPIENSVPEKAVQNDPVVSADRVALIFMSKKVEDLGSNLNIMTSVLNRMNKDYNDIVSAFQQQK